MDQAENEAVAAEGAVAGRVEVSALGPVLHDEHEDAHAGVDGAVGAQQLRVGHRQLVLQRDVAVEHCTGRRKE